jgi:hypothetical protein
MGRANPYLELRGREALETQLDTEVAILETVSRRETMFHGSAK